jgi:hypothetical protein
MKGTSGFAIVAYTYWVVFISISFIENKNKKIWTSPTGNRTQTKRVKTAHPNHWTIGDFGYIGN